MFLKNICHKNDLSVTILDSTNDEQGTFANIWVEMYKNNIIYTFIELKQGWLYLNSRQIYKSGSNWS
jgi:hypothetical protein